MSVRIHSQAIVDPHAQLGAGWRWSIAIIGPKAKMGMVHPSCITHCRRGSHHRENNLVYLCINWGLTHDLKYAGGEPGLEVGTINFPGICNGTCCYKRGDFTCIGSEMFPCYSHVAGASW